jgi:hypothetical protein
MSLASVNFIMASKLICLITLLATASALPTQWRTAIVKRGIADLDKEYDYIVGRVARSDV